MAGQENGADRCVFLVADLTPMWADTIRDLQSRVDRVRFELVPPHTPPADLAGRVLHGTAEARVIIVDLTSDPIHGTATVTACRQRLPAIPVVVVAANPSQELARRIRLAGAFYLALDPVTVDEIRAVLESAFAGAARHRARTSACRDRQRILIVDDDPDFLTTTSALLQGQGYSVSAARSGKEGLARLSEEAPDLVVLDIMMEDDWAGCTVNQQVKFASGFEAVRHVPILMVSSIPVDPAKLFSRAGEVEMVTPDAYLTKPIDIGTFLATVKALLGEREVEPAL
jgi:CheY-like chemotaxis protein